MKDYQAAAEGDGSDASGVPASAVAREHDIIIKASAGLYNAVLEGRGADVIVPLLDILTRFCREHFAGEEAAMRALEYPGAASHAAAHDELLGSILCLRERAIAADLPAVLDAMEIMGRLSAHIVSLDREADRYIQAAADAPKAASRSAIVHGTCT